MTEPVLVAWADQFGALLRDKVRQMQEGIRATGWDTMAHTFDDPYDDDKYRLVYERGDFFLVNLNDETGTIVHLDLDSLGVNR